MILRARLVSLGSVLLAFGCSSSHSSAITAAQACADLAMARCNLRSTCSRPEGETGLGASLLETYGDLDTCLAREALACTNELDAAQTGASPAIVELCVHSFNDYSCPDFFDDLPPFYCAPLGQLADGAACAFDAQCRHGSCNHAPNAVCGTCGQRASGGGDCSAANCMHGERCLAATGTCAVLAGGLEPCTAFPCQTGLYCQPSGGDASTNMICDGAWIRAGGACGGDTRALCDQTRGLYCGPAGTCARVTYAAAGSACGQLPDGTRVGCAAGGCYTDSGPASGTDMGTCKPFAADGDPCDTSVGPGCLPPARCLATGDSTAGTCVIPRASLCPGG